MTGKNLASLGSASQSSISRGSADVAIDGVFNFTRGADVYTATLWAPNQWWKVDLGLIISLSKVIIAFPYDQGLLNQIILHRKNSIQVAIFCYLEYFHSAVDKFTALLIYFTDGFGFALFWDTLNYIWFINYLLT